MPPTARGKAPGHSAGRACPLVFYGYIKYLVLFSGPSAILIASAAHPPAEQELLQRGGQQNEVRNQGRTPACGHLQPPAQRVHHLRSRRHVLDEPQHADGDPGRRCGQDAGQNVFRRIPVPEPLHRQGRPRPDRRGVQLPRLHPRHPGGPGPSHRQPEAGLPGR